MGPFDVTSEDIQRLDNIQLRHVLRFLLDAEAKQHGIPRTAIKLGGHQNAPDGGVDARVDWRGEPEHTDWLPNRLSIFQCKAEEMPKKKLKKELAPKGVLRPFFDELARKAGAYIVFSTNDCSETMYSDRISAMRKTVADVLSAKLITFDFYDASRIARWVNCFPGVTNQVRDAIGRSLAGWRPFENWSAPSLDTSLEYIVDEEPKVTFFIATTESLSIINAIDKVREHLRTSSLPLRLVGVSGVGKTRFAQALFDERIGQNNLNAGLVVYGDLGQSPTMTASQVAEQLVYAQHSAVLIVDNCPGETHRALASIIQRPGSNISLLTIDFDVGLDQPDNTRVVQLHQSGDRLIETLLISRAPAVSSLDRHRVVEFADGNARVALTIANAADGSGSLANLSDRQLIGRLFLDGRRPTNDTLRRCAEVASLVYAFHVDPENDQMPEHPVLAELAEVTGLRMYRAVAKFVDRGIAQKRGTQRAILPQALAIRLAAQALEQLPPDTVLAHFNQQGRERLFRSFTRRLGFLHQSEAARSIATSLLGQDGPFGDPSTLTPLGVEHFENLAPAAPETTLTALERAVGGPRAREFTSIDAPNRRRFAAQARNLAYDSNLFERAARVLLAFAKEEPEDHNQDAVHPEFLELFWISLSWTQASPDQRYRFIDELLADGDDTEKQLAVLALDHALKTSGRTSSHDGRFGSRSMGQQWRPKTRAEQDNWFQGALTRLVHIACQDGELADKAREIISHEIRGLIRVGLIDDLVAAVDAIRARGYWPGGWKRLCMAMHFDLNGWPAKTQAKLVQLEKKLRPISIGDRFSIYVTDEKWGLYSPCPETEGGGRQDTFGCAQEVGEEAAKSPELWLSLARQACAFKGSSNCHAFGRGLAKGTSDVSEMWRQLLSIFGEQEPDFRNAKVLSGFLYSAESRAPEKVQNWLDDAVTDEILGPHIVELSIHLPIDCRSIHRLTTAVRAGTAPIQTYRSLMAGKVTEPTPPDALVEFLRMLMAAGADGSIVSANILQMYFFGHEEAQIIDPGLLDFGGELLQSTQIFQIASAHDANFLASIAEKCLPGSENEHTARAICALLLDAVKSNPSALFNLGEFMTTLADLHPKAILDVALANDHTASLIGDEFFDAANDQPGSNRRSSISENMPVIIDWVTEEPSIRAIRVARFVRYFREDSQGSLLWTPVAERLLHLPGVGLKVLDEFYSRFGMSTVWGPPSNSFVRFRSLLMALISDADPSIRSWAKDNLTNFDDHVAQMAERERPRDERFE